MSAPVALWHLPGTQTLPTKPPQQELTYLGRLVHWLKADRPAILKIALRCLTYIAAAFLCLSIVGIPLVYYAYKESQRQDEEKKSILQFVNMERKRDEIAQLIGVEKFNTLPVLDLGARMGHTGYIDFLKEEDLSASLMKGVDRYKRPFISYKFLDKQKNERFVQTIFQRYTNESLWTWGGNDVPSDQPLLDRVLDKENIERFRKFIRGEDPRFVLAS